MEANRSPIEQKLTAIVEYAPVGIVEMNSQGAIIHINILGRKYILPVLRHFGLTDDHFYPLLEQVAPLMAVRMKSFQQPSGLIFISEICAFTLPGHRKRYFSCIANKLYEGCTIFSFEDITDKQEREEVLFQMATDKAMEQGKYEMASGVLHDIGNAVVGLGAYLNRMKNWLDNDNTGTLRQLVSFFETNRPAIAAALDDDKAGAVISLLEGVCLSRQEELEVLHKAVKEQFQIISHIQEVLNIQRQYVVGQELRERKPVELYVLVNDSVAMLQDALKAKEIEILVDVPAALPPVSGDRTRLMQVMLNVIKNSLEAFTAGLQQRKIQIRAWEQPPHVMLEIADNGDGFEPEKAAQLFERGVTTKLSGTGLGLYNCRAIIESHSGTISITSEGPGKGAVTTLQFLNR